MLPGKHRGADRGARWPPSEKQIFQKEQLFGAILSPIKMSTGESSDEEDETKHVDRYGFVHHDR